MTALLFAVLLGAVPADSGGARLLSPSYRATALSLPSGGPLGGLAVSREGLALVAMDGGVAVAGTRGWLIEPRKAPVLALAAGSDGRLVALRRWSDGRLRVIQESADAADTLAILPDGNYQIAIAGPRAAWVWGRARSGTWAVWRCEGGRAERILGSPSIALTALAPMGEGAALVAVGPVLAVLRAGAPPLRLATLQYPAAGLAVASDGSVLIASATGLFRLAGGGTLRAIALGLTGPIQTLGSSVFVLDRTHRTVVRLVPSTILH